MPLRIPKSAIRALPPAGGTAGAARGFKRNFAKNFGKKFGTGKKFTVRLRDAFGRFAKGAGRAKNKAQSVGARTKWASKKAFGKMSPSDRLTLLAGTGAIGAYGVQKAYEKKKKGKPLNNTQKAAVLGATVVGTLGALSVAENPAILKKAGFSVGKGLRKVVDSTPGQFARNALKKIKKIKIGKNKVKVTSTVRKPKKFSRVGSIDIKARRV